jgi:hypothetical protein
MPLDPNISLGLNTAKPVDPIQTLSSLAGIQNALNQNKLFQQKFEANRAMGPILQGAIDTDPNSAEYGDINTQRAMQGLAGDPRTAFMANDFVKALVERRKAQLDIQKERLEIARTQVKSVNEALGSLSILGDAVTRGDVVNAVGGLVANGVIDARKAAMALTELPAEGPQLAQAIQRKMLQSAGIEKQLDLKYGQIQNIDLGGTVATVAASPMTGVRPLAYGGKTMTPAEAAQPVEGPIGPQGETTKIPLQQFAQRTGVLPGQVTAVTGADAVEPQQPTATSQVGPASTNATATSTSQQVPGGIVTSLPLSRTKMLERIGGDTAEAVGDLNERVEVGSKALMRLEEMRELMKEIRLGGGSELRAKAAQFAQMFDLPAEWVDKIAGGNLGAAQEFQKFALQNSTELLRQMLVGSRMTNMEFQQFVENNPQLNTDPRAVENIYNFITRMYNYDTMQQREFINFMRKPDARVEEWPAYWTAKSKELKLVDPIVALNYSKSIRDRSQTNKPPGAGAPALRPTQPKSTPATRPSLDEIFGR